jgi:DNA-binding NarL/FixJ family response regulator
MKILVVDDHAIFREGLKRILSKEINAATFGEAGNATEALDHGYRSSVRISPGP